VQDRGRPAGQAPADPVAAYSFARDHGRDGVNTLLSPLLGLGGWEAYALVGALCFGEAALFVGFVLPGETAVVLGGVLASEHHVSLSWICTLVVVCAIVGDSVGYEVGRKFGPYLLAHRPLRGHPGVERTREFLQRRGAYAVFVGRFAAVFRALVPGVAGASEVRYRTFLAANALGGLVWGIAYTLAGYAVGKSYQKVLTWGGRASSLIIGVVVVAAVVALVVHHRRSRAAAPPGEQHGD
jgi:membrane protein DedA with SNARE-associated domain